MQLSNGERPEDPLARFRAGWRSRARSVKDTWLPGTHPIEAAMEGTLREGVAFAAELLEKEGSPRDSRAEVGPAPRPASGLRGKPE